MIKTTIRMPVQTPALKIPPTIAQLLSKNIMKTNPKSKRDFIVFDSNCEKSCQRTISDQCADLREAARQVIITISEKKGLGS